MCTRDQAAAEFFAGDIRVQPDHLDGEFQLVDDSLAGAVSAGEEFEMSSKFVK